MHRMWTVGHVRQMDEPAKMMVHNKKTTTCPTGTFGLKFGVPVESHKMPLMSQIVPSLANF